jgi:DNA-binding transcriptional regulator YdaS (Cro superfamily)
MKEKTTIEQLRALDRQLRRKALRRDLAVTSETISRWLNGRMGMSAQSVLLIKLAYQKHITKDDVDSEEGVPPQTGSSEQSSLK